MTVSASDIKGERETIKRLIDTLNDYIGRDDVSSSERSKAASDLSNLENLDAALASAQSVLGQARIEDYLDAGATGLEDVIKGNPGGEDATLHSQLADAADHVAYEADVVELAAEEIADPAISEAAEDQAEAMGDAAEALDDAAEAARVTTAEVFTETGVAQQDQAQGEAGEVVADAIAGNPGKYEGEPAWVETLHNVPPDQETGSVDEGGWYGRYDLGVEPYGGVILMEDSQGFVTPVFNAPTKAALDKAWDELEAETNAEYGNPGEIMGRQRHGTYAVKGNPSGNLGTHLCGYCAADTGKGEKHSAECQAQRGNPGEIAPPVQELAATAPATIASPAVTPDPAPIADTPPAPAHWYTKQLGRKANR